MLNRIATKLLLLVTATLFVATPNFATNRDYYLDLLSSPIRPPINAAAELVLPYVSQIPYKRANARYDWPKWTQRQIKHSAKLIAQLEFLFPGATFAFLGRDMAAHADLVESFYDLIGEKDRVVRIGISKPTFWDNDGKGELIVTKEEILESLNSYGFSFESIERKPFVLVDTLSRGGGRQGRVIIDAVYRTYVESGKNPVHIVNQFAMIGLATSTYPGHPEDDLKADLNAARERYEIEFNNPAAAAEYDFFENHPIVVLPEGPEEYHESGYEHYTGAWNGRYGRYERDEQGRLRAKIGATQPRIIRQSILWHQKNIYVGVTDPVFLERVKIEAKNLGYEFPIKTIRSRIQGFCYQPFTYFRR